MRGVLLMVTGALLLAGCGDGTGGSAEGPNEGEMNASTRQVECGQPFSVPQPEALRLQPRLPERAPADPPLLTGETEVTALRAIDGVAMPSAGGFLLREGRVVGSELAQDASGVRFVLGEGESRSVPVAVSLQSCEPGGSPLPPGDYELVLRFVVTPEDGEPIEAFGGPATLTIE